MTDKELLLALLEGKKIEKVRKQGEGRYIHLVEDCLVDESGNISNIYRLNSADTYRVYQEPPSLEEEDDLENFYLS